MTLLVMLLLSIMPRETLGGTTKSCAQVPQDIGPVHICTKSVQNARLCWHHSNNSTILTGQFVTSSHDLAEVSKFQLVYNHECVYTLECTTCPEPSFVVAKSSGLALSLTGAQATAFKLKIKTSWSQVGPRPVRTIRFKQYDVSRTPYVHMHERSQVLDLSSKLYAMDLRLYPTTEALRMNQALTLDTVFVADDTQPIVHGVDLASHGTLN